MAHHHKPKDTADGLIFYVDPLNPKSKDKIDTTDLSFFHESGSSILSGRGIRFDGSNDYIVIRSADQFKFKAGFSVSVWVKPDLSNWDAWGRVINMWGANTSTAGWFVGRNSSTNNLEWRLETIDDAGDGSYVMEMTDGVWQHFVGVYDSDNSKAFVYKNGVLVDFYREESLSRIKGDKSFPRSSIKKLLLTNNLKIKDIERVAFYERPLSAFLHIIKEASLHMPRSLALLTHQFRNFNRSSVSCYLDFAKIFRGLETKLIYSDHHLSHTLTALTYSNFRKDICSVVVDGFGDRSTASISQIVDPTEINELWECPYPVSLGLFYSSITDYLGFAINEGEYKVMGLASFGDSNSKSAKLVRGLMNWDSTSNQITSDMRYFDYHLSTSNSYSSKLEDLLGPARNPFVQLIPGDSDFQRCANIARGAQDLIVYLLGKIFTHAHKITSSR